MKICTKCGVEKPLDDFYFQKNRQNHRGDCQECRTIWQKEYKRKNKNIISKQVKEYRVRNREVISLQRKVYYQRTKRERIEYSRNYRLGNRDLVNKRNIKQGKMPSSYLTYGHRLLSSDKPESLNGILTVTCKYCGKQHTPCRTVVMSRIQCIDGKSEGEANFYCSDECKQACPIYNFKTGRQIDPRSTQYIPKTEQQTTRNCQSNYLKQNQCDTHEYNYCERCGDIIDVELHHTLTVAHNGTDAVNSAGHILLCAGCHITIHQECV